MDPAIVEQQQEAERNCSDTYACVADVLRITYTSAKNLVYLYAYGATDRQLGEAYHPGTAKPVEHGQYVRSVIKAAL